MRYLQSLGRDRFAVLTTLYTDGTYQTVVLSPEGAPHEDFRPRTSLTEEEARRNHDRMEWSLWLIPSSSVIHVDEV